MGNIEEIKFQSFQVDALSVRSYLLFTDMAIDAASWAGKYLQDCLKYQDNARVILATGTTQIKFLEALIKFGGIDWSRIVFFHLDEYLGIEANHIGSFRRYLRDRVENVLKSATFHYIKGDAIQPLEECDRYTQILKEKPIDLCLLGIGENGHLAFNEPSIANFNDTKAIKLVKLDNSTRQQQVNQGYFSQLDAVPQYAFTLTIPTICAAKKILCMANGDRKSLIIKEMLKGEISPKCPASVLRLQSHATLFLDADAANLL